ncbi:MAG: hypothetical protein RIQ79_826 [Verrucomicrobiota bacterium]
MHRHLFKPRASFHLLVLFVGFASNLLSQSFVHPGGLHTQADLDRMKEKVAAGEHPWIDAWERFIADGKSQNTYKASPGANMPSRQRAQDDATAMYYNTLRWYISGDTSYADCAVRIANAWSSTVNKPPAGDYLTGIPVGSFAVAGEVLRIYPGWKKNDFERFKTMLVRHWYPKCNEFLTTHGGSPDSRHWANWDAASMLGILATGVLCDDREKFDQAVAYFKAGKGRGSIMNAVPFAYPGGLGQWQESGRDQAHTMGGMGLLSEFCQVAWNQGLDLFGYADNRLLAGAEYAAQYTLWIGVPYTFYDNADRARQFYVSENYHGRLEASHFELLYNHYVVRQGLKAPNVKRFAELRRPEPGETDVFGHGTLTFTLDSAASPFPAFRPAPAPAPLDLTATAGIGRVELAWSPSGTYTAHGYRVSRATSEGGPYTSIYSTTKWTTPRYTDTKIVGGTIYYYVVSALNQAGASPDSVSVSATPVVASELPRDFAAVGIGTLNRAEGIGYAEAGEHSFVLPAKGTGVGGGKDGCQYVYTQVTGDFTITARFLERSGPVYQAGLMMREDKAAEGKMLALTLGEAGERQTRFVTRALSKGAVSTERGNDYTWLPVWFRLQRVGDVFTASQSSDGATWFMVGTSTVSMAKSYLVGLIAAAGNKAAGKTSLVTFDHVATTLTPPPIPEAPSALMAQGIEQNSIKLTWKNGHAEQAGIKVEHSSDQVLYYEIADLRGDVTSFVNTGLVAGTVHHYRIRAYTSGGYSERSNSADAVVQIEATVR